jgi:DNA-binding NarL/FixJ family response regulator
MTPSQKIQVLVMEDEALLAMAMEDMLLATNLIDVTTAGNLEDGLLLAGMDGLDFAVLDFNLGDSTDSIPVAELLQSKAIRFVFVTSDVKAAHEAFPSVPVLSKPVNPITLAGLLGPALKFRGLPSALELC